ncbi:MAG: acetylxylan esterase [Acidobacteria bacterium]|nr:acetylxylan esterase [Acidobacteriota bacterium]MBI3424637.1 acetylxylan esterase [Acidobacteriota bacterium]
MPSAIALAQVSTGDRRAAEIRHLDLDYTNQLHTYQTREEWQARAECLRNQILVSTGLWPQPAKQPLRVVIFDKVDRGTHTIEKVYFESFPGHYVSGNLYRPKNQTGKVPAVLCPHGHWSYGRLENTPLNSGPLRAASFAQQGYVAFTWDMVGYNDSAAISHRFASGHREGTAREVLWGVNLLGLQLWNSMRAVDFLLTLPEVDAEKIGCTGESGGGTQTFLLAAVDERIKVAAPVNMVSTLMQGGSLCENAPNLRIDTNNVELAALFAPRPLLMVSATGDWTKNTLTVEYPAVRNIYRLFGAEEKLHAVQMNAPHNYNQDSREAVYGWFAHWFKGRAEITPIKERGVSVATLPELLVFFGRSRPANELTEEQLIEARILAAQQQLATLQPATPAALPAFREQLGTALKYSLMAEYPKGNDISVARRESRPNGAEEVELSRQGVNDRLKLQIYRVASAVAPVTILVTPPDNQPPQELLDGLRAAKQTVVTVAVFADFTDKETLARIKFFTTYNRTTAANRIQDVLTTLAYVQQTMLAATANQPRVTLVGLGEAGLWTLLARGLAPRIERTIVDAGQFDTASDEAFLQRLPIPGLRRAGDFVTAVTLAPLAPLVIHNSGERFKAAALADVYRRLGRAEDFRAQTDQLTHKQLLALLTQP